MDDICRLCCSSNFVNNHIFDEENALYLKMSLYLPIKVFKNDRLPQRVCDKCSCKVNDFYQFCNETIEVQNRLRAVLISTVVEVEESVDLTLIKHDDLSPLPGAGLAGLQHGAVEPGVVHKTEPTSVHSMDLGVEPTAQQSSSPLEATAPCSQRKAHCDQSTQTEGDPPGGGESVANEINIDVPLFHNVKVKEEPKVPPIKMEDFFPPDNYYNLPNLPSDNSEDNVSLITYQKKKRKKTANGDVEKKKRKPKLQEWELLLRALPEGTALTVVEPRAVKHEPGDPQLPVDIKKLKSEPVDYHCCICFVQCYSRTEMLQHYKAHARESEEWSLVAPVAPPPPAQEPLKCPRCQRRLEPAAWGAHWLRHWERDRRPYRCALCEKTFRDHHQILKHGLSHKLGEEDGGAAGAGAGAGAGVGAGGGAAGEAVDKRYVCDLCPEAFVHMRYLLAHRTRAHPEAAARALAPRCAVCARQFAHLNSLRRHLIAHSGQRNFLCNVCGKALSSREHLKFHIRIHTGYKPNVCKTCGKGFVKKCNLTLHERVHSGEKPHVCAHCGKAFSQRSTLVIHERYHSGARPYSCALCGRGFVAKGLLSMHLKTSCV